MRDHAAEMHISRKRDGSNIWCKWYMVQNCDKGVRNMWVSNISHYLAHTYCPYLHVRQNTSGNVAIFLFEIVLIFSGISEHSLETYIQLGKRKCFESFFSMMVQTNFEVWKVVLIMRSHNAFFIFYFMM